MVGFGSTEIWEFWFGQSTGTWYVVQNSRWLRNRFFWKTHFMLWLRFKSFFVIKSGLGAQKQARSQIFSLFKSDRQPFVHGETCHVGCKIVALILFCFACIVLGFEPTMTCRKWVWVKANYYKCLGQTSYELLLHFLVA